MKLEVLLYPQGHPSGMLTDKKVVVLDILRATSTIVTALAHHAIEVIPVVEPAEVVDLVRSIGAAECVTGGERKGLKIEGLELGNSPLEYTESGVRGKKVILCTTNGTKAIKWTQGAAEVIIGSYLNIDTVVDYLKTGSQDIVIICSGREMNVSLEDLACAGMIVQKLQAVLPELQLSDAAQIAKLAGKQSMQVKLEQFIKETDHGRYLIEIGMEADLQECVTLNKYQILPRYCDGKIYLEKSV